MSETKSSRTVVEAEVGGSSKPVEQQTKPDPQQLFTNDPITLSQFLALKTPVNSAIIKTFQDKAAEIAVKEKQTAQERRWLSDYCVNHGKLIIPSTTDNDSSVIESGAPNLFEAPTGNLFQDTETIRHPTIKLNELVKKPSSFDGYKPPARRWLDDYEKASDANGWSDALRVRYFSTFLEKTANDWYITVARRKLGLNPTWQDLRSSFIRHYLGDSDKMVLRRQIDYKLAAAPAAIVAVAAAARRRPVSVGSWRVARRRR